MINILFWLGAASAIALIGMAWLALAMAPHWDQVMQRPAADSIRSRRLLRALGAIALLLSLLACLKADQPSLAVLVWIMLMSVSAPLVAMALTYRPQLLQLFWPLERS